MRINIGVRKPIYPKWVNEAIKKLSSEDKDQIIKCEIYTSMKPITEGIEIHKTLQKMSNRIPRIILYR